MGCGSSKQTGNSEAPRPHAYQSQQQQQQQLAQQQQLIPQTPSQLPRQTQAPQDPGATGYQRQTARGTWPKLIRQGTTPVTISVYPHNLSSGQEQRPCWSYISYGLFNASQPEIVFTISRRLNEDVESFPEAPLEWIKTIYALANGGLQLESGQLVELVFDQGAAFLKINQVMVVQDPQKWQSMRRHGSLCHGIPLSSSIFDLPPGVIPPSAHHVIALTHEETAVAKQFGVTRVIGHLGFSVRWFPYPPWIDRDRADVTNMADQAGSVRIGIPIARMYGLNAMLAEDDIVFTIPPGEELRKAFRAHVLNASPEAGIGFESFMVPEADSGLLWKKGQTNPMGYTSNCGSMSRLNLGFIMFAPQQAKDSSIMCEDGYGILIRDSTWSAIRAAIQSSQDISVPLQDDKRFVLQWKHSVYHNPMDNTNYTASWRTYNPTTPARPSNSHVQMSQMVFLVEPPNDAIDTQELVAYVKGIVSIVEQQTPTQPLPPPTGFNQPGRQLVVEFQLPKCEGWLKMTAYPSLEGVDTQGIMERIAALKAPEARSLTQLQLFLNLWGYKGQAAHFS